MWGRFTNKWVHEAVAGLPDQHRELVVLRYFDDLTVPQIADITGIAEGSVKRKLHEAKKAMRASLLKSDGERFAEKVHS